MDDFYLAPGSPTDGSDYIVTATALSGTRDKACREIFGILRSLFPLHLRS